ncbi:HNH endonuclease [Candidatus Micrarchaeota archaeon]|nr:HNH endonuclease [Candidatus Micrarchaeota archaeon]
MQKPSISTNFAVFLREKNSCTNCKRQAEDGVELKISQLIPSEAGGTNSLHNLLALCGDCAQISKSDLKTRINSINHSNRIPATYSIGILQQALRSYRSKYQKSQITFDEAFIAANNPEFVKGLNPLFSPIPKIAILSSILSLKEEGKLTIEGKTVKF